MADWVRDPAVAGRFYPADPEKLRTQVGALLGASSPPEPRKAIAVMAPHAGYMYSGGIAGQTFAGVQVPERAVVLCPNHTGLGVRRSLWGSGAWRLPGASVPVDAELAALVGKYAKLEGDRLAHVGEHAIEVELPLMLARQPALRIVPVCLAGLSLADCHEVGRGLARAVKEAGGDVLIVASSDMSHYISAKAAARLDRTALDRVIGLDPDGLYETVTRLDISMCGYVPATVALVAARELAASRAQLVRYGSSGEASGDFERVVGYAGVVVS
jgi:MEMO1 family protein